MGVKNQLCQIIQFDGSPVPEYVTLKVGGDDQQPVWQSMVKFRFESITHCVVGESIADKFWAEISAAEAALLLIDKFLRSKV